MFGLAVPLALATASAVWAATTPRPVPAGNPAAPMAAGTSAAPAAVPPAAMAAAVNPNCTLIVPPDPLSAAGLATPYRLVATNRAQGACNEANTAQSAFVQATIADPATGMLAVYNPLVVDNGKAPAAAPVTPTLPAGAVVGIWFGFNGTTLTLRGNNNSLAAGHCVNGAPNSPFGQFAYCNAPAFFSAANAAIMAGKLTVPPLQMGRDGKPCPTTRDFSLVDMDQSDNVTSTYLAMGNGATAQDTAANRAALGANQMLVNASDNRLLDNFVAPALGCTPFTAPNLADGSTPATSLALNELQAANQQAPVALVPPSDPMVVNGAQMSLAKTNLYRAGVNQPALGALGAAARTYCADLVGTAPQRLQLDRNLTQQTRSPDAAAANNLFTFLAQRLSQSFTALNCGRLLNVANPVRLKLNNGVTVDATFTNQGAGAPGGGNPPGTQSGGPTPNDPQPSRSSHF
jgi:hypothetical protein